MPEYTRPQSVASFLSRVDIKGERDCWLWKGCTYNCGYGSFLWRGKMRAASRVSWEIAHGKEVPEGLDILHTCDVRLCVNPAHLWAGTHQENMLDMHRKGRAPLVSLKPDQVREIRKRLAAEPVKGIQTRLAREYGVNTGTISQIARGRTYRHVEDEPETIQ